MAWSNVLRPRVTYDKKWTALPQIGACAGFLGSHAVVYNNRQRVRFSDGIEHVEDLIQDLLLLVSVH